MQGDSPDEEHVDPHGECRAEIEKLRAALEPFASLGAKIHPDAPDAASLVLTTLDGGIIDTSNRVTVGDLRRAIARHRLDGAMPMDDLDRRLRAIFVEEMTNRATSAEAREQLAEWTSRSPTPGSTGDAVMAAMIRAYYAGRASVPTDQVLF